MIKIQVVQEFIEQIEKRSAFDIAKAGLTFFSPNVQDKVDEAQEKMGTDFSQKLPMPGGVKVNKDNQYYDERELDEDEVIFNGRYLKDLILETSFKISNYFNLIDLSNRLRRSPIAIGSTVFFISVFHQLILKIFKK